MKISRFKQLARIAKGFPDFLRKPMTINQAMDDIRTRMENREDNFLVSVKKLIYENQDSLYRKLLLWAGCNYNDLENEVTSKGIEKTLEKLRDEGVYIALEEFKSKVPIVRIGLTIEHRETDFDNPYLMGKGIQGSTSGSRSKGTRVIYDLDFIAEASANDLLLYETHGVSTAPFALWVPGLPATAGFLNVMRNLKFRRPPERWFSQICNDTVRCPIEQRLGIEYISWCCRVFGLSFPVPEFVDVNSADKIARWMEKTKKERGISVVKTYASSAVRIVQVAKEKGIDISGSVIFASSEPLTERRYRFIESTGVRVFSCYAAIEAGLIGASCENRSYPDDMHIYLDKLAVIQRHRRTTVGNQEINSFLFTSLSPNSGKILLNAEIGDFGRLELKPCSCLFGELGMNVRISDVRSHDKLTGEGMTLLGSELDDIVAELIIRAGGSPDDYQFWETEDSEGLNKLIIAVNPKVRNLNERDFINTILERLQNKNQGANITSQLWRQADTLQVVRAYPELTKGYKMLPILKKYKQPTL